MAGRTQEQTE
jgi:hypothetical protein